MKHILLTNDDGYDSHGLQALIKALSPIAKLTVVAPSNNKSACGHSLTLDKPLKLIKINDNFYKVKDGTPTDCIFLSLGHLFNKDDKPDLVVSGINIGANMGEDVTYSGTVGAAMEAVIHGIPSIAISQVCKNKCKDINKDWNYSLAINTITKLVNFVINNQFPLSNRNFLNVNIPPINDDDCKGIKITKCGYRNYDTNLSMNLNPRGEKYFWIGTHSLSWKESYDKDCDFEAIKDNYISITPIKLDMTSYNDIKILKQWVTINEGNN